MNKILVTGFEPFNGGKTNSSMLVLEELKAMGYETKLLPVSYKRAREELIKTIDKLRPDFILSLGQAGGADKIRIEKIGINFCGASIKDNDGVLYQERRIDDGPDAIMTSLSCMDIIQLLGNENIPSTLSLSAGGFICNLVYFTSLEGMSGDALFIHLPYAEGEGNPSLSISYMRDAIVKVLEYIKRIEK